MILIMRIMFVLCCLANIVISVCNLDWFAMCGWIVACGFAMLYYSTVYKDELQDLKERIINYPS